VDCSFAFGNLKDVLATRGFASLAIELILDGLPKHSAELNARGLRALAEVIT
jgi:hypothetical protein